MDRLTWIECRRGTYWKQYRTRWRTHIPSLAWMCSVYDPELMQQPQSHWTVYATIRFTRTWPDRVNSISQCTQATKKIRSRTAVLVHMITVYSCATAFTVVLYRRSPFQEHSDWPINLRETIEASLVVLLWYIVGRYNISRLSADLVLHPIGTCTSCACSRHFHAYGSSLSSPLSPSSSPPNPSSSPKVEAVRDDAVRHPKLLDVSFASNVYQSHT